jgi:hypothetical protein
MQCSCIIECLATDGIAGSLVLLRAFSVVQSHLPNIDGPDFHTGSYTLLALLIPGYGWPTWECCVTQVVVDVWYLCHTVQVLCFNRFCAYGRNAVLIGFRLLSCLSWSSPVRTFWPRGWCEVALSIDPCVLASYRLWPKDPGITAVYVRFMWPLWPDDTDVIHILVPTAGLQGLCSGK